VVLSGWCVLVCVRTRERCQTELGTSGTKDTKQYGFVGSKSMFTTYDSPSNYGDALMHVLTNVYFVSL